MLLRPTPYSKSLCLLLLCVLFFAYSSTPSDALSSSSSASSVRRSSPQGSAATPIRKTTIGVLSGAGYLGAMTYGFLQRSAQLYGTGIGRVSCIGATADTAVRLNQLLGMHFTLAFADESTIALTNLASVAAIQARLERMDALILGTNMAIRERAVVPATYETSPNDKAWEVYWDTGPATLLDEGPIEVREQLLDNVLQAAQRVRGGQLRHLVVVDDDDASGAIESKLQATGVPYTRLCTTAPLMQTPSYFFKDGVQAQLTVSTSPPSTPAPASAQLCREDLAALCVQVLQSLSWDESRTLYVSTTGAAAAAAPTSQKRIDQQWCVNAEALEVSLAHIS